ncbi:MAG TPA: alanine racemase [Bryobacteraceae bacterium]|nr:alanine racemase [Bryobacteraceae bacterium]
MPQLARSYVEISLSRLAANYRAVRDAADPGSEVMAVVKANAYGHGAVEVARVVCAQGGKWLAVSSVEEGVLLRNAGIPCRILVMAGVMTWERAALREFNLTPVVHSLDDLRYFDESPPIDVHLKIDTGMNRLGTRTPPAGIAEAIGALRNARVEGVLSHFASAADFESSQTDEQIQLFDRTLDELARLGFRPALTHFSSTNAIAYPRGGSRRSLVRPGHAIYGYVSPAKGNAPAPVLSVKPALSWRAKIIAVKDVPAGAKIGYGGTFKAAAPMRLAVLAAGYADGIPHRLSNKGKVIAGGRLCSIIGPVSMDLTTIDISQSPQLVPGDEVLLLGQDGGVHLDAQQIARVAGTISYSVLCGISGRVKRFYVD